MLGKILITALVIAVVVVIARVRSSASKSTSKSHEATVPSGESNIPLRTLAYITAAALIGGAILFYVQHWRGWHEVVEVRVVNTQNGEVVSYKVHKGSIQERSFKTVDGWKVTASELERLEMLGSD